MNAFSSVLSFVFLSSLPSRAEDRVATPSATAPTGAGEIVCKDWLVLESFPPAPDGPIEHDAVFARHLLDPSAAPPKEGDALSARGVERKWQMRSTTDGVVGGNLAWACTTIESSGQLVMAQLHGARSLFVNGEGFVGDVERYGFRGVPVVLAKGANRLFVQDARERFSLRFWSPDALSPNELVFADWDLTLPDLRDDSYYSDYAGLLFFNASTAPVSVDHVHWNCDGKGVFGGGFDCGDQPRPIGPLCPFQLPLAFCRGRAALPAAPTATFLLQIGCAGFSGLLDARFEMPIATHARPPTVTICSRVDGSVRQVTNPPGTESSGQRRGAARMEQRAIGSGASPAAVRAAREFRTAFDRRFLLVYGSTGGVDCERELLARARYDCERWWYANAGTPRVMSDRAFQAHGGPLWSSGQIPDLEGDAEVPNVILYGNADTNLAWKNLVDVTCPLVVRNGEIRMGEHVWKGDDLLALCVRPRASSANARLGLIGATGTRGARFGHLVRLFDERVDLPGLLVVRAAADGTPQVLVSGSFCADWKLDPSTYFADAPRGSTQTK